jgi:deoxycytidylate deaminase
MVIISKNISKRIDSYVEFARALRGSKQTGQSFHVTFICKKRKVIAIGVNSYIKLCPSHKVGSYLPNKSQRKDAYVPGLHSEIAAIIKAGYTDCSDFVFFNIRINNKDEVAPSKPCPNCQRVLHQIGFKSVYYFDKNGEWKVMKNS